MSNNKFSANAVFQRYEQKYILDSEQYSLLSAILSAHMQMDEYGLHTICTLYYDTDDYAIIRRSLDKPAFREKLRLRSYGIPGTEGMVYLELKKKFSGITYKRRVPLLAKEAENYLQHFEYPEVHSQIFEEINWFVHQNALSPKVLISYDRIALFGNEDPNLRITFDANVRWRDYDLDLTMGDYGALLLDGKRIMEIKTQTALPIWLCQIFSSLAIIPASFSKYGTVYRNYLSQREETSSNVK